MTNVVEFKPSAEDQEAIIELLEETLEKARLGHVRDIAIVVALRDDDGPQFWHAYLGNAAYATIVAGVSALQFDLHYRRYNPDV